jgi:hypothetical protein
MTFRAIAFLSLWTLLIGPIVAGPPVAQSPTVNAAAKIRR